MQGCLLHQMPSAFRRAGAAVCLSGPRVHHGWRLRNKKSLILTRPDTIVVLTYWNSSAVAAGTHFAARPPSRGILENS